MCADILIVLALVTMQCCRVSYLKGLGREQKSPHAISYHFFPIHLPYILQEKKDYKQCKRRFLFNKEIAQGNQS
jgi:hypothetical protein